MLQLISNAGANIITIDHQREDKKSEVNSCIVSMVLETRNIQHSEEICSALQKNGYEIFES